MPKKNSSGERGCLTFYISLSPKRQWHQTLGWFLWQLLMTRIKKKKTVNTPLVRGKRKPFQNSLNIRFKKVEISGWWSFLPFPTNAMLSLNGQIECMKLSMSITLKQKRSWSSTNIKWIWKVWMGVEIIEKLPWMYLSHWLSRSWYMGARFSINRESFKKIIRNLFR